MLKGPKTTLHTVIIHSSLNKVSIPRVFDRYFLPHHDRFLDLNVEGDAFLTSGGVFLTSDGRILPDLFMNVYM